MKVDYVNFMGQNTRSGKPLDEILDTNDNHKSKSVASYDINGTSDDFNTELEDILDDLVVPTPKCQADKMERNEYDDTNDTLEDKKQ